MLVKDDVEELLYNQELVTELDFIFAKASYAKNTDSVVANLSEKNELVITRARHPLLDPKTVVANDFILKDDKKMILITDLMLEEKQ